MNPQLNKKVKKYLDSYFKDTKANSPEHQEAVMLILKGALTDANFHSEAKELGKYFPKASKKYIGTPMEDVIESKGTEISKMAKYDGHDIIDAFAFYLSMSIGGSFGNRLMSLKESIEESLVEEGEKLDEKNVPTNPSKWSYYKAQAKKKFDVYPSAYANGWAAKQYKKAGGGWKSESVNEAKDMTFVDYLKVLDDKFLDAMKAVRGDNGSDAQIKPTRGDILQNFTLFRNYLSALTKKYKGDKTKLRFITERANRLNEIIKSVNEGKDKVFVVMYKVKKDLPNRNVKPSSAAYAKEVDAKKFLKSVEKDGGKGMIVKSNKPVGVKVNEAATRTAMEIGGLTGMNKDAIQKFVDDNKLDIEKLYQFVKKGKLADRIKLVSAIAGKPNNPVQKKMVKQFGESVNEKMVTPKRGHIYYQLTKDTPIKYVSGHSGIGLKVPGVLLHNEYDTINGKKGAYIIDYFGQHFYVDLKNKFASRIAHPENRKQNKDLMKNVKSVDVAPDHSDWKKYVRESVNEGRVEKEVLQKISKFETLLGYITNDDQYKPLVSKVKREIDKLKKQIEKNESVNEASVSDFEIGDFVHFKSKNKSGMVVSVKGNKVTINTPKGKITSDVKDIKVLHQDNVNESQLKEFKHKVGSETIQFKVSPYRTGISLIAASGNDLDKLQDVMSSEDEVKGEIRKSLEKKLRIPIEIDRDYEGAGFGFKIDLYSLAKMVK